MTGSGDCWCRTRHPGIVRSEPGFHRDVHRQVRMTRSPEWRCWLYARCGGKTIPFVRMFYGSPSKYILGEEHAILQGEGGEQGDPLMLLLCSLGQHSALEATQEELTG